MAARVGDRREFPEDVGRVRVAEGLIAHHPGLFAGDNRVARVDEVPQGTEMLARVSVVTKEVVALKALGVEQVDDHPLVGEEGPVRQEASEGGGALCL